jgi:hypothetical protein
MLKLRIFKPEQLYKSFQLMLPELLKTTAIVLPHYLICTETGNRFDSPPEFIIQSAYISKMVTATRGMSNANWRCAAQFEVRSLPAISREG